MAPGAGEYFCGSADFNIFTASKVSLPVLCRTVSTEPAYIDSKLPETELATGARPPTPKLLTLLIATAGARPASVRGREEPSATARNGEALSFFSVEIARFSQPSSVDFTPGMPDSI